jgi:hypothetical protein
VRLGWRLGIAFALTAARAAADEPTPAAIPPPPADFGTKQRLSDEDYRKKKEDGYFTGLPLANYDSNTGFGFGARAYYFQDGKRTDPLFAYSPYEYRTFAQLFFSTGGLQFHWLDFDAPALFGSPWRLRSQTIYERNTNENYFGIDERAIPLRFTGAPNRTYKTYSSYQSALDQKRADGTAYSLYNQFLLERPGQLLTLERSLLGGILRTQFGLTLTHGNFYDYTGKKLDNGAVEAKTRFREDCDTHAIVGCNGGWDNSLRVGLVFDTRDFEPDPNKGIYADLAADFGTKGLGSEYDYSRTMLAVRGYYSPIAKWADVVLAARGVYEVQSQGTPFFSMDTFPFTEDPRNGMGGLRSLRGYKQDRFVGHVMAMSNFEIRYTFAETVILKQRFGFGVVPFLDFGRVFNSMRETSLNHWTRSEGGGLRIIWNLATVIMVDYGISEEDTGLYINFGHIF